MHAEPLAIADVRLVHLDRHGDDRGHFMETYDTQAFADVGIDTVFVQDALSVSAPAGTLRGLHFQAPPRAQAKLVRVARGRAFDVVVDMRRGGETFGRHVAVVLADDGRQLFVPAGFAHGFLTLEPDTEIIYKLSDHYAPETAGGIQWDDPALGIDWPLGGREPLLSDRDSTWPPLAELGPGLE